ncbi:MAG TPA: tol-pal system-associated acyl-CoA thioesterase [Nevskiaceae bacterium]
MEVSVPVRVYYEDTDATGVVYHAAYVRYFERARTEWLRATGCSHRMLSERYGIAFTVASLALRFLRPARLDEQLSVIAEVAHSGGASLVFEERIERVGEMRPLATARVRVACVDTRNFRPCRLPQLMRCRAGQSIPVVGTTVADEERSEA